jgi:hypothetical protein
MENNNTVANAIKPGIAWYNIAEVLKSYRGSHKESVTKYFTALMNFLLEKSVLKINPFNDDGVIKADLALYEDDFTEAGKYLFTSGAIFKERKTFKHLEKALLEYEKSLTVGGEKV